MKGTIPAEQICAPGVRDGRQMAAEPVSSCAGLASGSQIPSSLGREPTAALLSRRSVLAGRETFTGFCPPRLLYLQQPSAGQSNPLGAALRFASCVIPKRPHLRFEGVLQDAVRHSPRIPLPSLSRGHFTAGRMKPFPPRSWCLCWWYLVPLHREPWGFVPTNRSLGYKEE